MFRKSVRKFLNEEAYPFYEEWEKKQWIPRSFWHKLGRQGFLCPWVDEQYGGLGADFAYSVVLNEELEKVGSGLNGVGLHNDIVVPYIARYGTEEQKARWLPGCVSGQLITAVAMTEPGTGSDLAAVRTTAIREGDYYRVNGQKTFITNGLHADLVVVVCKTDPHADPPPGNQPVGGGKGYTRFSPWKKTGEGRFAQPGYSRLIFEVNRITC